MPAFLSETAGGRHVALCRVEARTLPIAFAAV